MSKWDFAKGVWGTVITIITVWIAYGQFLAGQNIYRPSLMIDTRIASERFHDRYGPLSHAYSITNVGPVTAENFKISVVTKLNGKTIHEDHKDDFGDVVRTNNESYFIIIPDEDLAGVDFTKSALIEEVVLEYRGQRGIKFWCIPLYTYNVTYVYDNIGDFWTYHQDIPLEENVDCL